MGDYLAVLRRRRLLIAVITLACFGLALGSSLTKDPVYVAEAQIQFRDPLADLNIVGISGENIPELAPNQRSALNAQLVTRNSVTRRVEKTLDSTVSASGLQSAVTGRVSPQTNLVVLEASWGEPEFAAELANAFAHAARSEGIAEFRTRLGRAEAALQAQLKVARGDLPKPGDEGLGAATAGATFRVAALEQNLTQVRALDAVADPVQIASSAQVPGSPASPQPVRDSILGLALGLVFGMLAAFVRDSLDRRLRNAHEVHEELGMPVLGRIGEAAFRSPGLVANGTGPIEEADFESFRVLRMNLKALEDGEPLRSVLVTSAMAGEGKSSVSMSLASAAALAGQRVLLLECDLRKPSLARRMGIEREPGLTEYLNGDASPEEVIQVVELTRPAGGADRSNGNAGDEETAPTMACLTAGAPTATAPERLQSAGFHGLLEKVTRAYDLVIIDASPLLAVADPLEIAPHVDAILVCVRAQQTTRDQARAVRSALSHVAERPTAAVLTGLNAGDESYYGYYYGY